MSHDNKEQRLSNKQAVTSAIEQALLSHVRQRVRGNRQGWHASPEQKAQAKAVRVVDPVDGDVTLVNGVRQAWLDEQATFNHGIMRVRDGNLILMPQCEGEDVDPGEAKPAMSHKEQRELEEASKLSDDALEAAAQQAQRDYEEAMAQLEQIRKARGQK